MPQAQRTQELSDRFRASGCLLRASASVHGCGYVSEPVSFWALGVYLASGTDKPTLPKFGNWDLGFKASQLRV